MCIIGDLCVLVKHLDQQKSPPCLRRDGLAVIHDNVLITASIFLISSSVDLTSPFWSANRFSSLALLASIVSLSVFAFHVAMLSLLLLFESSGS